MNVMPITPNVTRTNRPSDFELCMRTCGCYRGNGGGFPGGPGFITSVTVSGQVIGAGGTPATNFPMDSNVNGRSSTSNTDVRGRYAVSGLRGSDIFVAPRTQAGVTATPRNYSFINLQTDAPGRNFTLRSSAPGSGF